jgi:polysaccharide deacetylase 2 family uncharacterized protein YibQ
MKIKTILIFFTLLILILMGFIGYRYFQGKPIHSKPSKSDVQQESNQTAKQFEQQFIKLLSKLEVSSQHIKRAEVKKDSLISLKISLPRGRPMEWVIYFINNSIRGSGYYVDNCIYENDEKGCKFQLKSIIRTNPVFIVTIIRSSLFFSQTAKMAIFISDFGFQADQQSIEFLSFSEPLTIGLIPKKKLSTWTAQIANEYQKELIIQLPMEPVPSSQKNSGDILMVHYPEERIQKILDNAFDAIPNFVGVSNLYGDRVLDDSRMMNLILNDIRKRNGYFLFNPSNRNSTVFASVKKFNIPLRIVSISLDTNLSQAKIEDTLRHCAMIAQKTGDVIVGSKPSLTFITALKKTLPVLKQNGIQLVYISDLVKIDKKSDTK